MTKRELLRVASKAYPDGLVESYAIDLEGDFGDGLAEFIARELSETYEKGKSDEQQLSAAIDAMTTARTEIDGVIRALAAKL